MEATRNFEDLVALVKILRKECPWDRKQTHESIKDNLIEEAYEAIDAIDNKNHEAFKKELGDLLLHIVFHSQMATETDAFDIKEVIYAIQQKLIRRHPHVFGDVVAEDEQEVAQNWETLKMDEGRASVLEGVPPHLPGLIRAQRMQEKAGNVGFDWQRSTTGKQMIWKKIEEELVEFKEAYDAGNEAQAQEEYGDLLFSIVNAGRFLGLQAEDCLRRSNNKFQNRFEYIEAELQKENIKITEASLQQMEHYWQQAKSEPE